MSSPIKKVFGCGWHAPWRLNRARTSITSDDRTQNIGLRIVRKQDVL